MAILVTGAAGFIGFHVARALLERGDTVLGVDCLTDYYDVSLKRARLAELARHDGFRFEEIDLADAARVITLMREARPSAIVHLAAQAGVRYSLRNPFAYTRSNVEGFLSLLEGARKLQLMGAPLRHFVYASSSSVYGERPAERGFREDDPVDAPVSLYAATKRADELMAHTYAHLYALPLTGLRFFTVYGPWGRPDMAYFSFAQKMRAGETLQLFNHGRNLRDFTYIADIVPQLLKLTDDAPRPGARMFNIGGSQPVDTLTLVAALERALGVSAKTEPVDAQPGDVSATWADTTAIEAAYGPAPHTALQEGVAQFAAWFDVWTGHAAPVRERVR
ncbi:MAG: NAD-dependent epimerase/dehydratase family protein [Oceanicaulis sp.]